MRYAIIGSGMMGQEHILNLKLLPDAEVVALADPDATMRAAAAALVGGDVAVFSDHRDLLKAGGVDALVIASPNHTHHGVLMDALDTALPILVEEPLCTTVDHCESYARICWMRGEAAYPR